MSDETEEPTLITAVPEVITLIEFTDRMVERITHLESLLDHERKISAMLRTQRRTPAWLYAAGESNMLADILALLEDGTPEAELTIKMITDRVSELNAWRI